MFAEFKSRAYTLHMSTAHACATYKYLWFYLDIVAASNSFGVFICNACVMCYSAYTAHIQCTVYGTDYMYFINCYAVVSALV